MTKQNNRRDYYRKWAQKNREKVRAAGRKWRKNNRDKAREATRNWQRNNVEKRRLYKKDYCKKNPEKERANKVRYNERNRVKLRERSRVWRLNNPGYQSSYESKRLLNDIQFFLTKRLRSRVRSALNKNIKSGSSIKDLGCTVSELKIHLEKRFKKGMTWNNRGRWHIDHRIPLDSFDLTDREQFLRACHYTNLQPLWAFDNLSKGAKIIKNEKK